MKAAREHRVPLSKRALAIVEALAEAKTCDYVFPSPRGRRPLARGDGQGDGQTKS
jgi:integrase